MPRSLFKHYSVNSLKCPSNRTSDHLGNVMQRILEAKLQCRNYFWKKFFLQHQNFLKNTDQSFHNSTAFSQDYEIADHLKSQKQCSILQEGNKDFNIIDNFLKDNTNLQTEPLPPNVRQILDQLAYSRPFARRPIGQRAKTRYLNLTMFT